MEALFGPYRKDVDNFKWVPGSTFLSDGFYVPVSFAVGYLVVIFGMKYLVMPHMQPLRLKFPLAVHNIFLSLISAAMCGSILFHMIPFTLKHGWYEAICDPRLVHSTRGAVVWWEYLFYVSKVYEFLDTLFQVLRKKDLQFLHVYHHVTTLVLCFLGMQDRVTYLWVDSSLNTAVHVIMYYYYYIVDQGRTVWWKKYITTIQIVQFILDLSAHAAWYYYQSFTNLPCNGTWRAFHASNLIIGSFLLLFIRFYIQSYNRPPRSGAAVKKAL
eukprot:TRINITY_DN5270_c0_g1_i2.p1 TRINITY_DN5270_c0_g1~~TRINITY_DN5270_c0_g1_i2.p1  ORF type:complete len:270 (+),score=64.48 TRINITY_DN5270_c0_g1_i2:85-894(+)